MTQSLIPISPAPGTGTVTVGLSRSRRMLRTLAILACLPYLGIKVAWIAGSRIGIPEGSSLLEHPTAMVFANGLSVLMDAAVIVLALVLTRPWGLRTPVWLLVFPLWVATGLLAPIMAGFPLQLLVRALCGTADKAAGSEPFLDEWVFPVVYTGFIVQGLALGALFALYARDRWGYVWRGRMRELPAGVTGAAQRAGAVAAAVLAVFPLTLQAVWACGGTAGLSAGRAANRASDFYVVEAVFVVFLLAAVAGGWLLAFRRGRLLPVKVPLALAWVGSGAAACWGGWLSLASLSSVKDIAQRPTQLMNLTYAGEVIVGILVATIGAYFFAERSAGAPQRSQ